MPGVKATPWCSEWNHKCRGCRDAQERPAEGDQVLGMAGLAAYPQKTVLETATFEIVFKFPLHITRQGRALGRQLLGKCRVMLFDDLGAVFARAGGAGNDQYSGPWWPSWPPSCET